MVRLKRETGVLVPKRQGNPGRGKPRLLASDDALDRLANVPAHEPVVVPVHGYKYSPQQPARNPHDHLLAGSARIGCPRAVSWPQKLGLRSGCVVGFGWEAGGTIWHAQAGAAHSGAALAQFVASIGRPIDLIAHSLGARVALNAMARLPQNSGAEFRSRAHAVRTTPGGASAEIINVCSRENDVFDALYEMFVAPHRPFDRAIGSGLGRMDASWLDLQLNSSAVRAGLAKLAFSVPPPDRRVCHWSGYMRTGTWPLYRALIEDRLPLTTLRRVLPEGVEPRWSRLFEGAAPPPDLPGAPSAPS